MFKPGESVEVHDWITPAQVQVVKVSTAAECLERINRRAQELREQMGPRYLCAATNRVKRLDGRIYLARDANANVVALPQKRGAKLARVPDRQAPQVTGRTARSR